MLSVRNTWPKLQRDRFKRQTKAKMYGKLHVKYKGYMAVVTKRWVLREKRRTGKGIVS